MLIVVMEFLITTENEDLLFQEIMESTRIYLGSISLFMISLEPFIYDKKLKIVPDRQLTEIIDFYKDKNDLGTIEKLILSLDT